jgi:hypothetical protein
MWICQNWFRISRYAGTGQCQAKVLKFWQRVLRELVRYGGGKAINPLLSSIDVGLAAAGTLQSSEERLGKALRPFQSDG